MLVSQQMRAGTLTLTAPAHLRCSVVALGYNICMAVFGGTTPMIATYLVNRTGDDYAPVHYALAATLVAIPVIWRLPKLIDRAGQFATPGTANAA